MEASTEQVQKLMEIGCVAAGLGYFADAAKIFDGLMAVRPDSELPLVGQAVGLMNAGSPRDAVDVLRAAIAKNPDSELAMSFLGVALHQCGLGQASRDVLQQVIDNGTQPEAVALAKAVLNPAD